MTLVKFSRMSASWPLSLTSRNVGLEPAAGVVHEHVDVGRTRAATSPSQVVTCVAVPDVEDAAAAPAARPARSRRRTCRGSRRPGRRPRRRRRTGRARSRSARPMPTAAPVTIATRPSRRTSSGPRGIAEVSGGRRDMTPTSYAGPRRPDERSGMGYSVAGKHVLVTGASSGIGAALAEGFAAAGATVGICARREDRLARGAGAGPGARARLADVDGRPRRPRRHRRLRPAGERRARRRSTCW